MSVTTKPFGSCQETVVKAFCITNASGASATVITYGGRLISLKMPDRSGKLSEVILGFDDLESYEKDSSGQGALIGRYGNRISRAQFSLNGQTYHLAQNDGRNHLHGGSTGYSARVWDAGITGDNSVTLRLFSPDGEENYPGTLQIAVSYTLTDENELRIHYTARTDRETVINLTNHSYFNLSSCSSGDVLEHTLQVESDAITEANPELIPTGKLLSTGGTAFDFTKPKKIGRDIRCGDKQLKLAGGYDHNFVLRGKGLRRVATLCAPDTGRCMDVLTDQCGMQVYSANFLNCAELPLRGGRPQQPRAAICLETQHYPDSPNHPEFPTTVLKPGELYDTTTIFRFYTA
ncbi:MAG: galactose mutarotase [Firmicutes bacterium]|nr:galactose mutarotase [Bacillota bacterium]